MISKAKWQTYIQKLAAIDAKAAEMIRQYIEENGLENSQELINYAYGIVTKYGEASAELSCEMYDLMAKTQGAVIPPAEPADTATIDEVARGVQWGKYHSPNQIPSIVSRQTRQAGADTMVKNAIRDQAEWAWVPSGDTCAFCIALASRGWQTASKKVLKGDHAEHIHQNCDCTFGIAFNEKGKQQYDRIYDPQKYADMYYGADGKKPQDKINALRRARYQQNPEYFRAQKRDAYQYRKLKNNPDDIKIQKRNSSSISSRNHPTGNPAAIALFNDNLNKRQLAVLNRLQKYDDRAIFNKRDVNMKDLAALTAKENVEFALFTKGNERLVIRGGTDNVNIFRKDAQKLALQGYRWSGHTHPGMLFDTNSPSRGDRLILEAMSTNGQKYSVIYSSTGRKYVFAVSPHDDIGQK